MKRQSMQYKEDERRICQEIRDGIIDPWEGLAAAILLPDRDELYQRFVLKG